MATTSGFFNFGSGFDWVDNWNNHHYPCLRFIYEIINITDSTCTLRFIVVGDGHNGGNYTANDIHEGYSNQNPFTSMGTNLTVSAGSSNLSVGTGSNRQLCNNGTIVVPWNEIQNIPIKSNGTISFDVNGTYYVYYYADRPFSTSINTNKIVKIKDPIAPSIISIIDNGDNTVTVNYRFGRYINSNTATIYFNIKSQYGDSFNPTATVSGSNGSQSSCKFNIPYSGNCSSIIIHGEVQSSSVTGSAKYYKPPNKVSNIFFENLGRKKGSAYLSRNKNTIMCTYKFSWKKPNAGSSDSPVKGYRIRVFRIRGKTETPLWIDDTTGNYADREWPDLLSWTIDMSKYTDTISGDRIKIGIYAFSKNGKGTILWQGNGSGRAEDQSFSNEIILVSDHNYTAWARSTPNSEWKKVEVLHAAIYDNKGNRNFKEVENIYEIIKN